MITCIIPALLAWFGGKKINDNTPLFRLELPKSGSNGMQHLANDGVVVVIGANGTGKSRLGSWIELQSSHKENTHRISAQRSLQFPRAITSFSAERAKLILYYGERAYEANVDEKIRQRWQQSPDVPFLDDYADLMTFLFSDHNEETNLFHLRASKGEKVGPPPETRIMKV